MNKRDVCYKWGLILIHIWQDGIKCLISLLSIRNGTTRYQSQDICQFCWRGFRISSVRTSWREWGKRKNVVWIKIWLTVCWILVLVLIWAHSGKVILSGSSTNICMTILASPNCTIKLGIVPLKPSSTLHCNEGLSAHWKRTQPDGAWDGLFCNPRLDAQQNWTRI